jgi:hypothetical protein
MSCLENDTACRTTDRLTGRATSRGYVEGLEQQNRDLWERIKELDKGLLRGGFDAQRSNVNSYHAPSSDGHAITSRAPAVTQTGDGLLQDQGLFYALPGCRSSCCRDPDLVFPLNSPNIAVKGTAFSVLGMEIDITDFNSLDMDEPDPSVYHPLLYNKSFQAFQQTVMNINPTIHNLDLPSRTEGILYAEWYSRNINAYLPVLHKPTLFETVGPEPSHESD